MQFTFGVALHRLLEEGWLGRYIHVRLAKEGQWEIDPFKRLVAALGFTTVIKKEPLFEGKSGVLS